MADQARDLNQMMGRYRIDETAAGAWVAPARQRANVAASGKVVAAKPSSVERRSAGRPWSKGSAKAAAEPSGESAGDAGAHKKIVGSATSDSEWQEF
jgi:hypothetical protein